MGEGNVCSATQKKGHVTPLLDCRVTVHWTKSFWLASRKGTRGSILLRLTSVGHSLFSAPAPALGTVRITFLA